MAETFDYELDITGDFCPITFVKTKLMVEKMQPGETARVRLNAGEPLENVPRSLREEGHEVLSLTPEGHDAAGVHILTLRKCG